MVVNINNTNCLKTVNPNLAKEWHPTKNKGLSPKDVYFQSSKKVWWKCSKGVDHEWESKVNNRSVRNQGCPVCSGYKIVKSNCLATVNPNLAKEWHPTKNKELSPKDVYFQSTKKIWWKCSKGDDHIWEATITNRTIHNSGCPICSGHKIVKSNCLATVNPDLAKEWHPTKNGNLSPNNVGVGTGKKVWWKCPKGDDHEWKAVISSRSNGSGCPICSGNKVSISNSFGTAYPDLAKEWHPTKNLNKTPFDFTSVSSKKVWWKCPKGDDHEWKAVISSRSNGTGCPICKRKKVVKSNCLATTHPEISKLWHPKKNKKLNPNNVVSGSNKKVWWKCPKGDDHEWITSVAHLTDNKNATGCPICTNSKIVLSNSLYTLYPKILKEIDFVKNKNFDPKKIGPGSAKKIWWKCSKGPDHSWKSTIVSRTSRKFKCPICSGQKLAISNSFGTVYPDLAKEWHPTKNLNKTPFDFTSVSGQKVWWKCKKGIDHEWKSKISNRVNGRNCPFCSLTPQSRQELIITHELMIIFKKINPKGFKTKINNRIWSIDIYIPELNLGIEFDGSHWHKDKMDLDKLKTEELQDEGFNIIRIRQKPLKRIFDSDVIAEKNYNGKQITNDLLNQIMKNFNLEKRTKNKIYDYIKKSNLQNEKGLEKYIDMILSKQKN